MARMGVDPIEAARRKKLEAARRKKLEAANRSSGFPKDRFSGAQRQRGLRPNQRNEGGWGRMIEGLMGGPRQDAPRTGPGWTYSGNQQGPDPRAPVRQATPVAPPMPARQPVPAPRPRIDQPAPLPQGVKPLIPGVPNRTPRQIMEDPKGTFVDQSQMMNTFDRFTGPATPAEAFVRPGMGKDRHGSTMGPAESPLGGAGMGGDLRRARPVGGHRGRMERARQESDVRRQGGQRMTPAPVQTPGGPGRQRPTQNTDLNRIQDILRSDPFTAGETNVSPGANNIMNIVRLLSSMRKQ